MSRFTFLCVIVAAIIQTVFCYDTYNSISTPNGRADSTASSVVSSAGSSGSYGGGYGGGFGGGYNGGHGINSGAGSGGAFPASFSPFPLFDPFVNPGEFNKILGSYFEDLQKNYASGLSITHATPDATAYASSSLYPNKFYQQQLSNHAEILNNIRHQVQSAPSGSNGYAPNYASASASYGPGGIHQTASIYPENPNSPNIDTRYGTDKYAGNEGRPGFFGISTSSFSESSNINGVEKSRKGAVTTVNDNGKITSYKTDS